MVNNLSLTLLHMQLLVLKEVKLSFILKYNVLNTSITDTLEIEL